MTEWIIGGGLALAAFVATFLAGVIKGGSREKLKHEREEHNRYVATGKRIDQAVRDRDGDNHEWLRDRSER